MPCRAAAQYAVATLTGLVSWQVRLTVVRAMAKDKFRMFHGSKAHCEQLSSIFCRSDTDPWVFCAAIGSIRVQGKQHVSASARLFPQAHVCGCVWHKCGLKTTGQHIRPCPRSPANCGMHVQCRGDAVCRRASRRLTKIKFWYAGWLICLCFRPWPTWWGHLGRYVDVK